MIDPRTGTLYVGTGQNYTGSAGDFDTMLALNARTGGVRWKNQVTKADTWRTLCNDPDPTGYCPGLGDGTALDYDIGATPNIFRVGDRTLVGVGQKLGVYHVFDARTGEVRVAPAARRAAAVRRYLAASSGVPATTASGSTSPRTTPTQARCSP